MTDKEMNIAMAEACGARWRCVNAASHRQMSFDDGKPLAVIRDTTPEDIKFYAKKLPDYLHDLNAMYDAEEIFYGKSGTFRGSEQTIIYERLLARLNSPLRATARQRAEAFLITIGKLRPKRIHKRVFA